MSVRSHICLCLGSLDAIEPGQSPETNCGCRASKYSFYLHMIKGDIFISYSIIPEGGGTRNGVGLERTLKAPINHVRMSAPAAPGLPYMKNPHGFVEDFPWFLFWGHTIGVNYLRLRPPFPQLLQKTTCIIQHCGLSALPYVRDVPDSHSSHQQ